MADGNSVAAAGWRVCHDRRLCVTEIDGSLALESVQIFHATPDEKIFAILFWWRGHGLGAPAEFASNWDDARKFPQFAVSDFGRFPSHTVNFHGFDDPPEIRRWQMPTFLKTICPRIIPSV